MYIHKQNINHKTIYKSEYYTQLFTNDQILNQKIKNFVKWKKIHNARHILFNNFHGIKKTQLIQLWLGNNLKYIYFYMERKLPSQLQQDIYPPIKIIFKRNDSLINLQTCCISIASLHSMICVACFEKHCELFPNSYITSNYRCHSYSLATTINTFTAEEFSYPVSYKPGI